MGSDPVSSPHGTRRAQKLRKRTGPAIYMRFTRRSACVSYLPVMSESAVQILVVEDEPAIQRGLCDVLVYQGYEPHAVDNGEDGLREACSGGYDLVLLDLMLPGISGFEVCEQLRETSPELPVLMLTARGAEEDVLRGFRAGADDYVTKPFSIAELLARVEALLRRTGRVREPLREAFGFGPYEVDPAARTLRGSGLEEELSEREVALLHLFARESGRIVSRRMLLTEVWGMRAPDRVETRTVDMHIAKLRRKLGPRGREQIQTVRGEGYRFPG